MTTIQPIILSEPPGNLPPYVSPISVLWGRPVYVSLRGVGNVVTQIREDQGWWFLVETTRILSPDNFPNTGAGTSFGRSNQRLFATGFTAGGVYMLWRSTDTSGAGWEQLSVSPFGSTVMGADVIYGTGPIAGALDGRVLAIHGTAVARSDNQGASWTNNATALTGNPVGAKPTAGAGRIIEAGSDRLVYLGHNSRFYVSTDFGVTWTASGQVFANATTSVDGVAYAAGAILAYTYNETLPWNALRISTDGGATWADITAPIIPGQHNIISERVIALVQNPYLSDTPIVLTARQDSGPLWFIQAFAYTHGVANPWQYAGTYGQTSAITAPVVAHITTLDEVVIPLGGSVLSFSAPMQPRHAVVAEWARQAHFGVPKDSNFVSRWDHIPLPPQFSTPPAEIRHGGGTWLVTNQSGLTFATSDFITYSAPINATPLFVNPIYSNGRWNAAALHSDGTATGPDFYWSTTGTNWTPVDGVLPVSDQTTRLGFVFQFSGGNLVSQIDEPVPGGRSVSFVISSNGGLNWFKNGPQYSINTFRSHAVTAVERAGHTTLVINGERPMWNLNGSSGWNSVFLPPQFTGTVTSCVCASNGAIVLLGGTSWFRSRFTLDSGTTWSQYPIFAPNIVNDNIRNTVVAQAPDNGRVFLVQTFSVSPYIEVSYTDNYIDWVQIPTVELAPYVFVTWAGALVKVAVSSNEIVLSIPPDGLVSGGLFRGTVTVSAPPSNFLGAATFVSPTTTFGLPTVLRIHSAFAAIFNPSFGSAGFDFVTVRSPPSIRPTAVFGNVWALSTFIAQRGVTAIAVGFISSVFGQSSVRGAVISAAQGFKNTVLGTLIVRISGHASSIAPYIAWGLASAHSFLRVLVGRATTAFGLNQSGLHYAAGSFPPRVLFGRASSNEQTLVFQAGSASNLTFFGVCDSRCIFPALHLPPEKFFGYGRLIRPPL